MKTRLEESYYIVGSILGIILKLFYNKTGRNSVLQFGISGIYLHLFFPCLLVHRAKLLFLISFFLFKVGCMLET